LWLVSSVSIIIAGVGPNVVPRVPEETPAESQPPETQPPASEPSSSPMDVDSPTPGFAHL